jgi:hypothetical protein
MDGSLRVTRRYALRPNPLSATGTPVVWHKRPLHWLKRYPDDAEAWVVRVVVPLAAITAIVAALLIDVPDPLPSVALGSKWILYGVRALALFYGILLVVVPVLRSLRGQLPIELSLRGAKYEDATAAALRELRERVDGQATLIDELTETARTIATQLAALEDAPPRSTPHKTLPSRIWAWTRALH